MPPRRSLASISLPPARRRISARLLAQALLLTLPLGASAADISWLTPSSGSWTDPTRWSSNPAYPNSPADNAFISVPGSPYTVTLNTSVTVNALTLWVGATLSHTNGVLTAGTLNLEGGAYRPSGSQTSLKNALIQSTIGATFTPDIQTSTTLPQLDHVTLAVDTYVQKLFSVSALTLLNHDFHLLADDSTLVFFDNLPVTGTGAILIDGRSDIANKATLFARQGTLTQGAGITLRPGLLSPQIVIGLNSPGIVDGYRNEGLLLADRAGPLVTVQSTISLNYNTLLASNGGDLRIAGGTFSNYGLVSATSGGSVTLSSANASNLGTISLSGPSLFRQSSTFSNAGQIQVLSEATYLTEAPLTGAGTLSLAAGAFLAITQTTPFTNTLLRDPAAVVAFAGTLTSANSPYSLTATSSYFGRIDLASGASVSNVTLTGSGFTPSLYKTSNATAATFTAVTLATNLQLQSNATLAIAGALNLSQVNLLAAPAALNPVVQLAAGASVTGAGGFGPGLLVRASAGTVTLAGALVNDGSLSVLAPGAIVQNLTLLNTGTLSLQGAFLGNGTLTNTGLLSIAPQGTFYRAGTLANAGTVSLDGGALALTSLAPLAGTFLRNSGFVALTTPLSPVNGTVDLGTPDPFYGYLDIGSGATATSLTLASASRTPNVLRTPNASASLFNQVTLATDLRLQPAAQLTVNNSLRFSNTRLFLGTADGPATLSFNGSNTVLGSGDIVFDSPAASTLALVASVTFPAGLHIRTGLGNGSITSGSGSLTLLGSLSAASPGTDITVTAGLANYGTIEASNGATLHLHRMVVNSSIIRALPSSSIFLVAASGNFVSTGSLLADGGTLTFYSPFFPTGYLYLGGTIQALNGGALSFNATALVATAAINLASGTTASFLASTQSIASVTGNGTVLLAASRALTSDGILADSWVINGTHTLRTTSLDIGTSKVHALSLATATTGAYTATLNINNNALILQPSTDAKPAAAASLRSAILSARNNGAWTGQGLTSTTVANDPASLTLALFDNADLQLASYRGQSLDPNSLLVTPALIGDANLDNAVDLADYDLWYKNVGGAASATSRGDFNLDNNIDLADYDAWYKNVGAPFPLLSPQSSPLAPSLIPEPTSLALLAATFPLLARRRPRSEPHR